ncbi:MAG: diaminopimelate epimerase [Spirochaetota bacterium]|nr:diaminopimelate epimerase [Spirochaetota bacterium]
MKFTKMHGAGNDYVYINCFNETVDDPKNLAIAMSNRNFGVGSDGLILIKPGEKAPFRMDMYNSDGSWSEMCGNGLRCVAKYIFDKGMTKDETFPIETGAGILEVTIFPNNGEAELVEINMGNPILEAKDIPMTGYNGRVIDESLEVLDRTFQFTAVSMGNPHCVIFVDEDLDSFPVAKYGPVIENHKIFPNRVNVEFVKLISSKELSQRTWERGSGETLACGTGASAVQVAGVLTGRTDRAILNHLLGGDLYLKWDEDDSVYLKGPAITTFEGDWLL